MKRVQALLASVGATLALALGAPVHAASPGSAAAAACPPLLQHSFPRLQDEAPQALCQYAGRVLLVVNTASFCGFTPQYEGLEKLNARYADKGLVIMGFPSNDFNQEAKSREKTADVCFNTYGVKFPMFTTSAVRGENANPLFRQLAQATGQQPRWNFNKYLVGRDGKPLAHFGSMTDPLDPKLTAAIEQALARR